jgi:rhodanese-related sulfurtransferase
MAAKLKKAENLIANNAVILDIRTKEEFRKGHLCGAHNIPTPLPPLSDNQKANLTRKLKMFLTARRVKPTIPIIVYCKKGIRAAEACCQLLNMLGMKHVYNLGGVLDGPLKGIMSGRTKSMFLRKCPNSL